MRACLFYLNKITIQKLWLIWSRMEPISGALNSDVLIVELKHEHVSKAIQLIEVKKQKILIMADEKPLSQFAYFGILWLRFLKVPTRLIEKFTLKVWA